jgi:excisionase family DNA binding protein
MNFTATDHGPFSEGFLTRSEVAHILCVSPTTVTRWAREGRLPCQKTLGGHHRFERTVIEEVREHMRQGTLTSPDRL